MLIAFTGPAGCGKTTAAKYLVDHHGFERMRFADPFKRMLAALGLTAQQTDGTEKERPCDLLCGQTPRWAMQSLGTEWGRECIDADLWVALWCNAYRSDLRGRSVVVDDRRFPNEVAAIRGEGGFVLRIDGRGGAIGAGHVSERCLSAPMLTINNGGSIEQFRERIVGLLRDLGWVGLWAGEDK